MKLNADEKKDLTAKVNELYLTLERIRLNHPERYPIQYIQNYQVQLHNPNSFLYIAGEIERFYEHG